MLPFLGAYITELREAAPIEAVIGLDTHGLRRVRGTRPAPGDALGPTEYQAFIVLSVLSAPPEPDVPVTFATIGARCYGATPENAWAVYAALVEATHRMGPRIRTNGSGFYQTLVVQGGEQDEDPDTKQPLVHATISLTATTQAVAA